MKNQYQVVVGNVGVVYEGTNGFTANVEYNQYVAISKTGKGKAGGETVTMIKNQEIHKEFIGAVESQEITLD